MATKPAKKKPNILVIFGDDIGYWNLSAYNLGVMGYTKKRMETVDDEFMASTLDFIDRAKQDQKPFFIWFNTTRMHIHTHLRKESQGRTGFGLYPDGMVEHDGHVGRLLDKLDQLGIADDTIVVYTTDNGAMTSFWPDGGMTPFRGEKDTNWEGAFRAPCVVRWPGVVKPGTQINEMFSSEDWLPTLLADAGDPDIVQKMLNGHDAGAKHFHVHLDGYDQTPLLSGQGETRRDEFYYFGDDGELVAMRYKRFKLVFEEQNAKGIEVWSQPFTTRRVPLIFDLRADPLERSEDSVGYFTWMFDRAFVLVPAQAMVGRFLATFRKFPSRQHPSSFSIDQIMATMENGAAPVH
ncbi:sulfatase-like hydrolase/transferase [Corallococcus aberystwythensis]|uniref:Sulfatase N-terminal domain-containing protein n=1 Tax=Corallococcus aberystwythensis TaxID=2316722 RepID=A0A3A8Q555_9BACT|nr:sulfatase-like hydrolase/transferase [Corallococcus aberystwythensis]RKH63829.1 hypothetical protein D7W81_19695 [Corallococcus aberystwythensis]